MGFPQNLPAGNFTRINCRVVGSVSPPPKSSPTAPTTWLGMGRKGCSRVIAQATCHRVCSGEKAPPCEQEANCAHTFGCLHRLAQCHKTILVDYDTEVQEWFVCGGMEGQVDNYFTELFLSSFHNCSIDVSLHAYRDQARVCPNLAGAWHNVKKQFLWLVGNQPCVTCSMMVCEGRTNIIITLSSQHLKWVSEVCSDG